MLEITPEELPPEKITLIDTLYLYGDKDISHAFYSDYVQSGKFVALGVTGGYHWFKNIKNDDRVGVCEQYQADKMNSYPVVYQYSKKNCHEMNFDTYSNIISLHSCRIKRIDTAITFHKKDYQIFSSVISPFQSKVLFMGKQDAVETLYLGKRATGKIVRHYNKSLELDVTENHYGKDYYNSLFGTIKDLFTLEVELNRKHLMTKFGDITYASIQNVISYSLDVLALCVFFPDTDENLMHYKNNNYSDIVDKFALCEEELTYISAHRTITKKASFTSLIDRTNRMINNYIESVKIKDEDLDNFYMYYFSHLLEGVKHDTMIDEVEFQFKNMGVSEQLKKELLQKVTLLRNNQDNTLEVDNSVYFEGITPYNELLLNN